MPLLFGRVASAIIDDIEVRGANIPGTNPPQQGLRIAFKVTKSIKMEPNVCELKVYNLSETTRRKLTTKHVPVIVSAGYPGTVGKLFSGTSRYVEHDRQGTEWVTVARCGDGEREFQWGRFRKSFAPGVPTVEVVRSAAEALGLGLGNLNDELNRGGFRRGIAQYAHGYTAHGSAAKEMDRLMRDLGFTWSVQDGQLQVLRGTAPAAGQIPLLRSDTGLLGSPEHSASDIGSGKRRPPRVKFKALLYPSIVCGGAVLIESANVNGQVRIEALEHQGDTGSTDWFTTGECLPT
jgi:hypothetical protein